MVKYSVKKHKTNVNGKEAFSNDLKLFSRYNYSLHSDLSSNGWL